jgi:UDP-N-acetylmuramate dehydrogenase
MPLTIQNNVSLKALNTFAIDCIAKEYVEIHSIDDFIELIQAHSFIDRRHMILGGGSNLILPDAYEGLVIHNAIKGFEVVQENEEELLFKAWGGEMWHDLVLKSLELNVGGLENFSLIPGTVGAAPMQNIGAYGMEIKDTFESLEAIDVKTGEIKVFHLEDCQFGYRTSVFKKELKGQYFIASVTHRLSKGPKVNTSYGAIESWLNEKNITHPTIHDVSQAVIEIRRSKLPDPAVIPNAGSFFKNPIMSKSQFETLKKKYADLPHYPAGNQIKVPAAWLIEQSGWKGYRNETCGVHEKQALVIVNHNGASASDILELAQEIQDSVKEKFGIGLEQEVNVIF